jgi:peptidyl-prolyl cis-trans isomerase A (cyclophilin A)
MRLALLLTLTACTKSQAPLDKPPLGPEPGEPAPVADAEGEKTATPPAADAAPPAATDTADLTGTGPLRATFETAQGTIRCELLADKAPVTVANFIGLARGLHPFKNPVNGVVEKRPYYDSTFFHRVMPGFMVQGGDPTGTGEGGPGYQFANEVSRDLKHTPGTLSMANAGPNTNGSQFFITEVAVPALDMSYSAFGRCGDLAVVKKLAAVAKTDQPGGRERSRPSNPPDTLLLRVTISR